METRSLIEKIDALDCKGCGNASEAHMIRNNAIRDCLKIIRQHTAAPDMELRKARDIANIWKKCAYDIADIPMPISLQERTKAVQETTRKIMGGVFRDTVTPPAPASEDIMEEELKRCEIRDNKQLIEDIYNDLFDAFRTTDYVGSLEDKCSRLTTRILAYVSGHSAFTKPKPVSLKDITQFVTDNWYENEKHEAFAKNFLDAAGVKYVE